MLSRIRLQSVGLAAVVCLASAPSTSAETHPGNPYLGSHVRGTTPGTNALIARGAKRSSTFRKLIEDLNASDVVVYLELVNDLPAGLDGRLSFMTAAGGVRYVRAQVISDLGFQELIAVAGHELQHAIEVATHPEVRDGATLAALYERIGTPGVVKNRYDTNAAQSTGKRVRAELS
jgi:hypothetical protein